MLSLSGEVLILICLATARMSTGGKPKPYRCPPPLNFSSTPEYERNDEHYDSKSVIDLSSGDEGGEESDAVVSDLAAGVLHTHRQLVEVILFTTVSS